MRDAPLILALALAALAVPAAAAPIRVVNLEYQSGITVEGRHTGDGDAFLVDPVQTNNPFFEATYFSPTMFGWGRNTTTIVEQEDDRSFLFEISYVSEAFASMSRLAPETASISVSTNFIRYLLFFDVLETIHYSIGGQFSGIGSSGGPIRDRTGILDPGSYLLVGRMYDAEITSDLVRPSIGQTQFARSEGFGSFSAVAVPEPETLLLLASGFLGIGLMRRRRA